MLVPSYLILKEFIVFKPGDKVRFEEKMGKVLECINEDDLADRRLQGRRYYVMIKHNVWSITEKFLVPISTKKP